MGHLRRMGESAQTADRTALQAMLKFCRQRSSATDYLVVYKLDRFARFARDHHMIEGMLNSYGTQLRSVTEPVDESDTGHQLGTILSDIYEFENKNRRTNVLHGLNEA